MSVITLTTDFGTGSPYVAAMKGVILTINPNATIVDITHHIPPQNVHQGAMVLADVTGRFPQGTVHVAVIDPAVGTERTIVYAEIGQQRYVAPDNGLLSRVADRTPPTRLISLSNPEYWLDPVSATFHGRDIMAPVAAWLSVGLDPQRLGSPLADLARLDWPQVRHTEQRIEGAVLEIDSFGNLVTNISAEMLAGRPTDERVCVICSIYETWGIYHAYADRPGGTFIALIGSSGRLELAVVGDNAAERLGIQVGTRVVVAWE